jgi:hypothetical protein
MGGYEGFYKPELHKEAFGLRFKDKGFQYVQDNYLEKVFQPPELL